MSRRSLTLTLLLLLAGAFFGAAMAQEEQPAEGAEPTLEERAAAGDTEAMNYLGYLLLSDTVAPQPAEGMLWLMRAAAAGDVKAASNIGWLYLQGTLVERDLDAAVAWLTKAADGGLPVARSLLGDLYRDGTGVAADSLRADSLYREAFEGGLADAGLKLYDLNAARYQDLTAAEKVKEGKYYYLWGAPSEGVKLFYAAAEEGDAEALTLLGDAYSRALGVPYDYDLSRRYFVKGALGGNPSAQFVVGELLEIFPDALKEEEREESIEKGSEDLHEDAAWWFEQAAAQGVTDADEAYRRLLGE